MRYVSLVLALSFCAVGSPHLCIAAPAKPAPAPERECFSAAQTREKIAARKLVEPFKLLRNAAARFQAEAIGVRLCRWKEEFIYEISLLRRDGRVIRVFVNAGNGALVGSKNAK